MAKLPQGLPQTQMENTWATIIEPVLNRPANNSIILKNIELSSGTNVINHKLGRKLIGWNPTRVRSAVSLYDDQDNNSMPELTLILVADADAIIDLEVY